MFNDLAQFVRSMIARVPMRDESGQGLVEYGLILALVALIAVAALTILGTNIATLLSSVANSF